MTPRESQTIGVGLAQAQAHQQLEAGDGGSAGAVADQLDVLQPLALQVQRVGQPGGDHDGGAVLVVVEHGDGQARAQGALDLEALGGLDVFEVDAAKGGVQAGNDLDELLGVGLVDLDVKGVDAGKALEQHRLAFHHRLAGDGADVAQPQHGRAVVRRLHAPCVHARRRQGRPHGHGHQERFWPPDAV
jgi:hypothetical protein